MPFQTSSSKTWLQPRSASHRAHAKSSGTISHHPFCWICGPRSLSFSLAWENTDGGSFCLGCSTLTVREMLSSSTATDRAEPSSPCARSRDAPVPSNTSQYAWQSENHLACTEHQTFTFLYNLSRLCVCVFFVHPAKQKTCLSGVCAAAGVVNQADDRHLL